MRSGEVIERLSAMGAAAQAAVPGLYAWGVTVAPAAFGRGAPIVAQIAALLALAALLGGVVAERRWGPRARVWALWGFILACALAWSAVPAALGPLRLDVARGLAGMLGWGLYALACAAPALQGMRATGRLVSDEPALAPRRRLQRGDAAYVAVATLAAFALQFVGWKVAGAERALLVRLVALAAGLGLIGASVDAALARHLPRTRLPRDRRLRRAMATVIVRAVLGLLGVLFVVRS